MKIKLLALVACASLGASAPCALADPVNTQTLYANDVNGNPSTSSGDAAAIFNGGTGPELTANTSGGTAGADVYQYLSISLPSDYVFGPGDTYIPLTITYASNAVVSSTNYGGYASTFLDVNSFGGSDFHFGQGCSVDYAPGCGATGLVTQAFDFHYASKTYGVVTVAALELHMNVYAEGANASASLDPVIAFDPNALDSHLFPNGITVTSSTVTPVSTSGGLPSASAAPEPGSWLLMVLGVGALGSALRARHRQGFAHARPATAWLNEVA